MKGADDGDPLARMVAAAVVGDETGAVSAGSGAAPATPPATPQELKFCWGMMIVAGLVALIIPISLLFVTGPTIYPMACYSLVVGVAALARGAARDTLGLARIASLQMFNIMACDPVSAVAGAIMQAIVRRPHVREYLLTVNGGRL
jgi:hypothetical protein